ncbi:MAG: Fe3+/spermidine/putrescine ABC transporter ATP-binding protein [Candidatus Dactylopiibacterium carminicum]|uniref:ABC transporter ATP-binding protein n=1 Tax=Candidatus Dactylopiibacterium carminicum TaxID=857335 RepID=A0A272ETE9_9RHOO|nr:ABC transporter ATP-binding protein [Candidatus Dactylopiibacterium carminicum]KAF7599375.1 ABC transporter ATP-binding protein [Candidatus Dactylopiibacterium carminicum]PAS93385.1 MAG: Fe3+/spermidine/putrescine ABC transporter ATP-binding protein [Candidatus Dactylopiibacterium carminicum]PAS98338.1 MAG: Fe3+/spermidine/putrescine ABC transporter ATP-binding protein [Candidatus Dactylopiibacterium carminicum]PAS99384.1 MAG: Fe3+/spermidine/putrescine ABC transporter ATP-binding protein [C
MDEAFLSVDKLRVAYGPQPVLDELSLGVARGEFVALLGASGCGKTTLLRSIAGFIRPQAGQIRVQGRDVTAFAPDARGMAFVFQSYALWPHMTVAQNIGYALKLRRTPHAKIHQRVEEIAAMLGLAGLEQRKPAALSGGQRQRVALGRALAADPEILLLDEPLSNLDARIRLAVRHEISALQKRLGITAVHVTHYREEAMIMADRIVILDQGRIAQAGTPHELYNRPASAFVAAFMGAENAIALEGDHADGRLTLHSPHAPVPCVTEILAGACNGHYQARFRSDAARLVDAGERTDGGLRLRGLVSQVSYPGGLWRHAIQFGEHTVIVDAHEARIPGETVDLLVPRDRLFVFPSAADAPRGDTRH